MKLTVTFGIVLLTSIASLRAQVTINELAAATNERALRYDATGQARLGAKIGWFDEAFNASAWAVGAAPIGFSFSGLGTDLNLSLFNKTPSLYTRKIFTVTAGNAASTANLRLKVDYNDGFIAFLNGKEVARSRLGAVKMFAYADSTAFTARTATGGGIFNLGAANALLLSGTNLLAIQVANYDIDAKGNLIFNAALELGNEANTSTEYTQSFNDANGSYRTHANVSGATSNETTGSLPGGSWLALSPTVESSGAWMNLAVVSRLDATAGLGGTGGVRYTFTDTGAVQSATVRGPSISLANRWPAGAITQALLDQTTVTFRYKMSSATMGVDLTIEPTGEFPSAALNFGRLPGQGGGPGPETVGYWRFDDAGATNGGKLTTATSQKNSPALNGTGISSAKYSTDVPGNRIYDPIGGKSYVNTFSLDATATNARVSVANNALLNATNFTIECFLKLTGEPGSYDSFISRIVGGNNDSSSNSVRNGWQLDIDSGTSAANYGKIRSRWDTPGVPPPDFNKVAFGGRIFVDTPSGDGNPNNYTAVTDVQTVGDSLNDATANIWHHLAITYNGSTRAVTIYTDYGTAASFTLSATTFTHPNAALLIGKLVASGYELHLDEVRYANRVLATSEMLQASTFDPNVFLTQTYKLSQATAASQTAFLAALNGTSSTAFRLALKVRADSYDASGRNLTLDDFSITFSQVASISSLIGLGENYAYRVGMGEPSGGIYEPNLPIVLNNPSEAGKPAAFPDLPAFSDWIELKNSGLSTVNLTGWYLTDSSSNPTKWPFPSGTTISAGGYLLVLCDDNDGLPGLAYLHANFSLSEGGEKVYLYNGSAQVDLVDYPRQNNFVTYGRASTGGALGYFDTATPGAANPAALTATEHCKTPDFFSDTAALVPTVGGFYTGSQPLTMNTITLGAEIRYTTDGTEPTATSKLYTAPLTVTAAANEKTGRIYSARAFKAGAIASSTKSITYLINQHSALKGVPALCFTGDAAKNYFAPYGIGTVVGGSYDGAGVWSGAVNTDYHMGLMHGSAYERPVFLEWLRNDGNAGFSQHAGVRLASSPYSRPRLKLTQNTTSPWPADSTQKASFNLFFRNAYGNAELNYPFLGKDYPVNVFDQLRLRAGKNDISNPFIKDELVRRMFRDMGRMSVQGTINTLYVNGSYKGFYNTVERYRDAFFDSHYGVSGDWDIRINDVTEEGDSTEWAAMLAALQKDLNIKANFDAAMARIDLDEMIDYYLLNIYCATWDWPNNNWVAARQRVTNGVWRFHVWDGEGSFGHSNEKPPNYDTILTDLRTNAGLGTGGLSQVFRGIYASPEVKLRIADRINKWFFNGQTLDDRVPASSRIATLKNAMATNFAPLLLYTHGQTYNDSFFNNWTTATTATFGSTVSSNRRSHLFNTTPTPTSRTLSI